MNCLENKGFITFELKPLIKDCITYWIKDEYECEENTPDLTIDDIEDLADMPLPDDLLDTIYDATVNLVKEDGEYDIHISKDEISKIITKEWLVYRDNYVQYLYDRLERTDYMDEDLY